MHVSETELAEEKGRFEVLVCLNRNIMYILATIEFETKYLSLSDPIHILSAPRDSPLAF